MVDVGKGGSVGGAVTVAVTGTSLGAAGEQAETIRKRMVITNSLCMVNL
jgi:hypothetical protein